MFEKIGLEQAAKSCGRVRCINQHNPSQDTLLLSSKLSLLIKTLLWITIKASHKLFAIRKPSLR